MAATFSSALLPQLKHYDDFSVDRDQVRLRRPAPGKNIELTVNGRRHEIGRIANPFPLSSGLDTVVFFDTNGEEIGAMKQARELDEGSRSLLREELEKAYFMPRIEAVVDTEEKLGVETWTVETDKGRRVFEVRDPRRNVRSMGQHRVIIKDVDGNRYEIPNWRTLDRASITFLMPHL